jgi:hypothetical protein
MSSLRGKRRAEQQLLPLVQTRLPKPKIQIASRQLRCSKPKNKHESSSELHYDLLEGKICQIRLLTILPGDCGSIVRCRLHTVSLETARDYTALSYCWGSTDDKKSIFVNDCQVSVTVNLDAALQELRRREESVTWVDAICINQADDAERGHQVTLMGQIYSQSVKTVSWLGDDDDGLAETVFKFTWLLATKQPQKDFDEAINELRLGLMVPSAPIWKKFRSLYTLPYFNRVWILQEVAMSQQCIITWGQSSLPLETLLQAVRNISFFPSFGETFVTPRSNLFTLDQSSLGIQSIVGVMGRKTTIPQPANFLVHVLTDTHSAQASDPKDKIYGILGLCYDASILVKTPDYGKSLAQILLEVASNMVVGTTTLDIVCLKGPHHRRSTEYPTWVPDWNDAWQDGHYSWISLDQRLLQDSYQATKDSIRKVQIVRKGRVLQVKGHPFDQIAELYDLWANNHQAVFEGQPDLSLIKSAYGPETADAIWRTLIMDRKAGVRGSNNPAEFPQFFPILWSEECLVIQDSRFPENSGLFRDLKNIRIFGKTIGAWAENQKIRTQSFIAGSIAGSIGESQDIDGLQDFLDSLEVLERSLRRKIIISKKGYVGLGHAQCQVGDQICLLGGCSVPVILRELGMNHIVIGEAYVHGIMNGEFWDEDSSAIRDYFIY